MYTHRDHPYALYFIKHNGQVSYRGLNRGIDQMQALCLAVKTALTSVDINHTHHIIIWHQPRTLPEKILMLKPHRDNHITYNTQSLMSEYLRNHDSLTITLCYFHRA